MIVFFLTVRRTPTSTLPDTLFPSTTLLRSRARALARVPKCNVSCQGDVLHQYMRQDISVAVAAPSGLITPIIRDAGRKGLAQISTEMKELATKARDGKLQPHEFQGGTASLSNLDRKSTRLNSSH